MGAISANKGPVRKPVVRQRASLDMILGAVASTFKPPVLSPEEQKQKDDAIEEARIRQEAKRANARIEMAGRFGCVSLAEINLASRRPAV